MMKTKQHNDMTNGISTIYGENDIEQMRLIRSGAIFEETRQDNNVTNYTGAVYDENESKLS